MNKESAQINGNLNMTTAAPSADENCVVESCRPATIRTSMGLFVFVNYFVFKVENEISVS